VLRGIHILGAPHFLWTGAPLGVNAALLCASASSALRNSIVFGNTQNLVSASVLDHELTAYTGSLDQKPRNSSCISFVMEQAAVVMWRNGSDQGYAIRSCWSRCQTLPSRQIASFACLRPRGPGAWTHAVHSAAICVYYAVISVMSRCPWLGGSAASCDVNRNDNENEKQRQYFFLNCFMNTTWN